MERGGRSRPLELGFVIAVQLGDVAQRQHVPIIHGIGGLHRRRLLTLHLSCLQLLRLPPVLLSPSRSLLLERLGHKLPFLSLQALACAAQPQSHPRVTPQHTSAPPPITQANISISARAPPHKLLTWTGHSAHHPLSSLLFLRPSSRSPPHRRCAQSESSSPPPSVQ